jgi:hypothetical protein
MAFADLLGSLRTTKMFSHNRIAHQPLEKLEVTIRPWSNIDRDVLSVRHVSLRLLILIERLHSG